jgi:tetratricopeptide (TPR) repeat protein
MAAEAGDLEAAKSEAAALLASGAPPAAKARAAYLLGDVARADGATNEARNAYMQALKLADTALDANRSDPHAARWYARARGRIAELDASVGDFARAKTGAEGSLTMLRAAAAQIGETPEMAAYIADAELRLGALELDANQPSSARRRFREAIGRYEALSVTETSEPHWRAVLSDAWALAAEADYARGAPDAARDAMDRSLQARLRLAARDPRESWALAGTWRVRAALGGAWRQHGGRRSMTPSVRWRSNYAHQTGRRKRLRGFSCIPSSIRSTTLCAQASLLLRAKPRTKRARKPSDLPPLKMQMRHGLRMRPRAGTGSERLRAPDGSLHSMHLRAQLKCAAWRMSARAMIRGRRVDLRQRC